MILSGADLNLKSVPCLNHDGAAQLCVQDVIVATPKEIGQVRFSIFSPGIYELLSFGFFWGLLSGSRSEAVLLLCVLRLRHRTVPEKNTSSTIHSFLCVAGPWQLSC